MTRILVIDDEEDVCEALRLILEQHGYAVMCASNGRVALDAHRTEPFDLVITDLLMPEPDGIEVIMDLRRLSPEVKIIAISGGGQMGLYGLLLVAKKLGAQRALMKPFALSDLLAAVQEVLAEPDCNAG